MTNGSVQTQSKSEGKTDVEGERLKGRGDVGMREGLNERSFELLKRAEISWLILFFPSSCPAISGNVLYCPSMV